MASLVGIIAESRKKFHKDVSEGTYYPLSVYRARGFDTDTIETNCTDTEMHPIMGLTYKVEMHSVSEGQIKENVRKQLMDLKKDGVNDPKCKRKAADAVETAKSSGSKKSRKKAKKERSSSSSSSSSASSSSSRKTSSSMAPPKLSREEVKAEREKDKHKRQQDCYNRVSPAASVILYIACVCVCVCVRVCT